MKYALALITLLSLSIAKAEITFDKWHFSELLIMGLRSAGQGGGDPVEKSLTQLQRQLVLLNIEIDRLYPEDREQGLALAVDLLTEPIREAWRQERVDAHLADQRHFLERLFDLGSSENIANVTLALRTMAENNFDLFGKSEWLTVAGVTATPIGLGSLAAMAIHNGGPFFLGAFISVLAGVGSTAITQTGTARRVYRYRTNFIHPAFRACELELLRGGEKRDDDREGGRVSLDT